MRFFLLSEPLSAVNFMSRQGRVEINPQAPVEHKLVYTEGKMLKGCVYCQINKVKTSCGWRIKTYYKCNVCNIPLCRDTGPRSCFAHYHQLINESLGNMEHFNSVNSTWCIKFAVNGLKNSQCWALKVGSYWIKGVANFGTCQLMNKKCSQHWNINFVASVWKVLW